MPNPHRSIHMPFRGHMPFWGALVCGAVFIWLMGMDQGWFSPSVNNGPSTSQAALKDTDLWFSIYQDQTKIGYSHRQITALPTGYVTVDDTQLRITTMGLSQVLAIHTRSELNPDLSLKGFDFHLISNRFTLAANGEVRDRVLTVSLQGKKTAFPLESPIYLAASLFDKTRHMDLKPGQSMDFQVFDPLFMQNRSIRVFFEGNESLRQGDAVTQTRKFRIDVHGMVQNAWIAEDGRTVRETGLLGMTLEHTTSSEAQKGLEESRDLTRLAAVDGGRILDRPEDLAFLRVVVSGVVLPEGIHGERQIFENGILTIRKERVETTSETALPTITEYRSATPFIGSDHPDIVAWVEKNLSAMDPPEVRVRKIMEWIHDHIEKRPVLSMPDAVQTFQSRVGDCNEHAVLMAAMARAAGIPAQVEAGLVYMAGRFYYHAWNSVHLGRWITVDALMGQFPADVTHIRMVRGEPGGQVDLMGLIGTLKLKIVEAGPPEKESD